MSHPLCLKCGYMCDGFLCTKCMSSQKYLKLEKQLEIAREALKNLYGNDPEGVYAGPTAKEALAKMEAVK